MHILLAEWRKGNIEITGSNIKTTNPFDIEEKINFLVKVMNSKMDNIIRKQLLFIVCLSKYIHFPDGNLEGVGRILLNFILVANGFPNIAIKGNNKDRDDYIRH